MKKFSRVLFLFAIGSMLTACGQGTPSSSSTAPQPEGPYRKDEILALRQGTDVGFEEDVIGGSDITKDCDQAGTITSVTYETYPYAMPAETGDYNNYKVTKEMNVYTPYGYAEDTDQKYNVLILCHGSGENEDYWFGVGDYDRTDTISSYLRGYGTHQVLDNMMKSGQAEKTIVVTPSLYTQVEGFDTFQTSSHFAKELVNDILPYIINNYRTYATGTSEAEMIAAREHFAYAGLSYGGNVSYSAVMAQCLPYFAYIGSYSSILGGATYTEVKNVITENKDTYPVKYWLNCMGLTDGMLENSVDGYLNLMAEAPAGYFKPGSDLSIGCNVDYVLMNKTGHSYACWLTCLYNTMLVFFK